MKDQICHIEKEAREDLAHIDSLEKVELFVAYLGKKTAQPILIGRSSRKGRRLSCARPAA